MFTFAKPEFIGYSVDPQPTESSHAQLREAATSVIPTLLSDYVSNAEKAGCRRGEIFGCWQICGSVALGCQQKLGANREVNNMDHDQQKRQKSHLNIRKELWSKERRGNRFESTFVVNCAGCDIVSS